MAGQRTVGGGAKHQERTRLARLTVRIGRGAQHLDRWFNQPGVELLGRWKIERHSQAVLVLPAVLTFLLVWGPVPVPGAWLRLGLAFGSALAVLALCGGAHWWVAQKKWPLVGDALSQLLLLVLIVAAFLVGWRFSGSGGKAADNHLYVHAFVPLMLVPLMVVPLAMWMAKKLNGQGKEWDLFRNTPLPNKLFRRPDYVAIRRGTMVKAGVMMLVGRPLHIFVIPALFALLLPREYLEGWPLSRELLEGWLVLLITLVWMGILILGETSPRLSGTLGVVTYLFLRGGGRVVSWLMIALAAGRLLDVQYVSTVLDNASNWTILQLLLTVYVIFWWMDYWLNRLLLEQLLHVLGKVEPGSVRVVRETSKGLRTTIRVHGSFRLAFEKDKTGGLVSRQDRTMAGEVYRALDIFERLASPLAHLKEGFAASRAFSELKTRVSVYYVALAFLGIVGLLLFGAIVRNGPQKALVEAKTAAAASPEALDAVDAPGSLYKMLYDRRCTGSEPLIAVAASGGGTRAALFTASVLEGLERKGHLKDVVLVSGISGGSAALAYFAARRAELTSETETTKAGSSAWDAYYEAMAHPYIQDVLNGSVELRILGKERLGVLLHESFQRTWRRPTEDIFNAKLGDVKDVGIILNTAIAGHIVKKYQEASFVRWLLASISAHFMSDLTEFDVWEAQHRNWTSSESAGGRLIFTNLRLPARFPTPKGVPGKEGAVLSGLGPQQEQRLWTMAVADTSVELTKAAALSANFPPVFPAAAVDVDGKKRFWVTDGGAIDNRGMEMLLYALRDALAKKPRTNCKRPNVRVLVIEASAFSDKFSGFVADRGLGPVFGAGSQFASQLALEIEQDISNIYQQDGEKDGLQLHFLPMPRSFRQAGGLGTHWMLPSKLSMKEAKGESVSLNEKEIVTVIRGLHVPQENESALKEGIFRQEKLDEDEWGDVTSSLHFVRDVDPYVSGVGVLSQDSDESPRQQAYFQIWESAIEGSVKSAPGEPTVTKPQP